MLWLASVALLFCGSALAASYPDPVEGDFLVKDFQFVTGETLPELRLHYTTIGSASNPAVLIMHGTTGRGREFLSDRFAGQLFGPGQLLDATRHYIILTDAIGHGASSKPSDGLRLKFPRYTYEDMVRAQYRLITEKLGVKHLRLVMGTSMGGMHTWMWGYMYPDFMDALMPLASAPVEIGGRNRMLRKMIIDSIRNDPDFKNGEYTGPLRNMLAAAVLALHDDFQPAAVVQAGADARPGRRAFESRFYKRSGVTTPTTCSTPTNARANTIPRRIWRRSRRRCTPSIRPMTW